MTKEYLKLDALFGATLVLVALLVPGTVLSDMKATEVLAGPTVLVVGSAQHGSNGELREQQFLERLELALEEFHLELVEQREGFATLLLSSKLNSIRPLVDAHEAVAVCWLDDSGTNEILLHVISLVTGHAFVRIIGIDHGPDLVAELAFAAQELLGQIYLLSQPVNPAPIERVTAQVLERAKKLRSDRPSMSFSVFPHLAAGGVVWEREGPWIRFGGGLAGEMWVKESFFARVGLTIFAGPSANFRDGTMVGWTLMPTLDLGYNFRNKWLRIGPTVGVSPYRSELRLILGDGEWQSFDWWSLRGSLGLDLRIALSNRVWFVVNPTIGTTLGRKRFRRLSNDTVVTVQPLIDWAAAVGVSIAI